MFLGKVYVTLKPTVNDPQGKTVLAGLRNLGFVGIHDIRVGKFLEVQLDARDSNHARELLDEMCSKLLANPVIESYKHELEELAQG